MNTRLRDAIQALLSEHLRGTLLAADARQPVLGSTSIATPPIRIISDPPFDLSGLISGLASLINYELISGPIQTIPPDTENAIYFVKRLEKTESGYEITEWGPDSHWNNSFSTTGASDWVPYPKSFISQKSGAFSGEMRKVIQILAAQDGEIPFEHGWGKTHGIFRNSVDNRPWVIEITTSGISAWRLPTASVSDENKMGFFGVETIEDLPIPYVPLMSQSKPGLKEISVSGVSISTVYGGGPLSGEIGWAFSASGHKAANVVFIPGYGSGGMYSKAFLYEIVISADENGDPESAVISQIASDYAWSNNLGCCVRAPIWTECGPASARILFWSPETTTRPKSGDIDFPVFTYYIGETRVDRTYHLGAISTSNISARSYPEPQAAVTVGSGTTVSVSLNYSASGNYWTSGAIRETHSVSISGLGGGNIVVETGSYLIRHSSTESGPVAFIYTSTGEIPSTWSNHIEITYESLETASVWNGVEFCLTIPLFDRESEYWFFRESKEIVTANSRRAATLVAGGRNYSTGSIGGYRSPIRYVADPNSYCPSAGLPSNSIVQVQQMIYPDCTTGGWDSQSFANWFDVRQSGGGVYNIGSYIATQHLCAEHSDCDPNHARMYLWSITRGSQIYPLESGSMSSNYLHTTSGNISGAFIHGGDEETLTVNEDYGITFNPDGYEEDNDECTGGSPWWMASIADAFSTHTLLKATPDALDNTVQSIGADAYSANGAALPGSYLATSWFGSPHSGGQ